MAEKDRYYQPSDVTDALTEVQKLFNSYRNAPLTQELFDYHQKLLGRLTSDLPAAAKAEHRADLVTATQDMAQAMQRWTQVRLTGQPYPGRLRHFKFVPDATGPKFKRHVVKDHGSGTHRSSRH
ncbi:hypothetical protein [Levilactobacillus suantsaii]|uniref:Uncharacterized protein n=1 Tax=Levilactobacillus suantsaii TaxID=2292255 RepID=A0A4Q0VKT4_9LACO|nr:hypothetical protein [Levilactobacillus suantsaii]QMU08165.1 hypothetical protein H3M12_00305 [Levilactobacillus suantsaii]RXI79074.1 hypothetical protein DXH47_04665 [Levilactobacillus suantsaii]